MTSTLRGIGGSVALLVGCVALAGCQPEQDFELEQEASEGREQALAGAVSVGLHAPGLSPVETAAREADLGGVKFNHVLLFQFIHWTHSGGGLDLSNRVQPHLNAGRDVVINLEFQPLRNSSGGYVNAWEQDGNLLEIDGGRYDTQLAAVTAELNSLSVPAGRKVSIRTLHEMNGNWYVWCVNHGTANTVTRYKNAWWHVRGRLPAWVKMQLNFNGTDAGGAVDWAAIYPGDTNVDMVLFTNYNRYGLEGTTTWKSFNESISVPYTRAMNAGLGHKPFGVSETSSTPHPTNVYLKRDWFVDLAKDIVNTHTNIQEVTWFLEDKNMDQLRCWDWAYPTADGDPYSPHLSCAFGATRSQADKDGLRQATLLMQGGGGGGGGPSSASWYEVSSAVGGLLTGKNLDGTDNSRPTAAADGGAWSTQAWKFIDVGGGYYKLQSKYNLALFLTGKDEAGTLSPLPVNTTAQADGDLNSQKWQLVSLGGGRYQLKNLANGGCLSAKDAAGDYTTNYRRAAVHACDDTWTSQQWTLTVQ